MDYCVGDHLQLLYHAVSKMVVGLLWKRMNIIILYCGLFVHACMFIQGEKVPVKFISSRDGPERSKETRQK